MGMHTLMHVPKVDYKFGDLDSTDLRSHAGIRNDDTDGRRPVLQRLTRRNATLLTLALYQCRQSGQRVGLALRLPWRLELVRRPRNLCSANTVWPCRLLIAALLRAAHCEQPANCSMFFVHAGHQAPVARSGARRLRTECARARHLHRCPRTLPWHRGRAERGRLQGVPPSSTSLCKTLTHDQAAIPCRNLF